MNLLGPVSFQGRGLHQAGWGRVVVHPGPKGRGILVRTRDDDVPIRAFRRDGSRRCTRLVHEPDGFAFSVSEHVLGALAGLGLWDVILQIEGDEVPILDGSAAPFVDGLLERSQEGPLPRPLTLRRPVRLEHGESFVQATPASELLIQVSVSFSHPLVGTQQASWSGDRESFVRDIAAARTFGFTHELETLRRRGLARGGGLHCALVFGPGAVLNPDGPRFPDEPARHKMLDVIGDLALLGFPLMASVVAHRPSHELLHRLVERILDGASGS